MNPARLDVTKMIYPEMVAPIEWAKGALKFARLSELDKYRLAIVAKQVADQGGLRGDISDAWKRLGATVEHIPDLYV